MAGCCAATRAVTISIHAMPMMVAGTILCAIRFSLHVFLLKLRDIPPQRRVFGWLPERWGLIAFLLLVERAEARKLPIGLALPTACPRCRACSRHLSLDSHQSPP